MLRLLTPYEYLLLGPWRSALKDRLTDKFVVSCCCRCTASLRRFSNPRSLSSRSFAGKACAGTSRNEASHSTCRARIVLLCMAEDGRPSSCCLTISIRRAPVSSRSAKMLPLSSGVSLQPGGQVSRVPPGRSESTKAATPAVESCRRGTSRSGTAFVAGHEP